MIDHLFSDCSPLLKRLRVIESFVNVDSSVVRCLALAVLRQHVAVALIGLGFVALALALALLLVALAMTHVALLTSLLQAIIGIRRISQRLQFTVQPKIRTTTAKLT